MKLSIREHLNLTRTLIDESRKLYKNKIIKEQEDSESEDKSLDDSIKTTFKNRVKTETNELSYNADEGKHIFTALLNDKLFVRYVFDNGETKLAVKSNDEFIEVDKLLFESLMNFTEDYNAIIIENQYQ
jgi:hypothetical protein